VTDAVGVLILGLLVVLALSFAVCALRVDRVRPDAAAASSTGTQSRRLLGELWSRRPGKPLLPEGHRPPAGLGPLSPSERFLSSEAARGIRALQVWLIDQDGAAA
jgi:hypothetical protein